MAQFRFLHAADLHIDSPLVGLSRKSEGFAGRVDEASRQAVDNLISTAIDEDCSFVVISGDVFDGQWRDYRTGLFFADRMRKLGSAGIQVYLVLGNHDAENRFASRLELAANVHLFPHRKADTLRLESLRVALHGRSFHQRDVTENIALDYPPPLSGWFNIGVLHTSCTGRGWHDLYAPCSGEQLVNHGYDYWALGHVHTREIVNCDPYVVYPGNLQGRSPREAGSKGASLITVDDDRVTNLEHRALDVIRWSVCTVNLMPCVDLAGVYALTREALEQAKNAAEGRGLAVRLRFAGATAVHSAIAVMGSRLREEIETIAATVSDDVWIEKIELSTESPHMPETADPTVAGRIRATVEELVGDPVFAEVLERKLAEVREKMPAGAHIEDLFSSIRNEGPKRALNLALSLIEAQRE